MFVPVNVCAPVCLSCVYRVSVHRSRSTRRWLPPAHSLWMQHLYVSSALECALECACVQYWCVQYSCVAAFMHTMQVWGLCAVVDG